MHDIYSQDGICRSVPNYFGNDANTFRKTDSMEVTLCHGDSHFCRTHDVVGVNSQTKADKGLMPVVLFSLQSRFFAMD